MADPNQPSEAEVLAHARSALTAALPGIDVQLRGQTLHIVTGDRRIEWNLHSEVRLAATDSAWREGLDHQARQVAAQVGDPTPSDDSPGPPQQVRLRAASRISPELAAVAHVQPVWPGVVALAGSPAPGDRFTVADSASVEALMVDDPHWLARLAAQTLGEISLGDLLEPLAEGVPIYTNSDHPHAAVSLLVVSMWGHLRQAVTPMPDTLYAVAPAPGRFFVSLVPDLVPQLTELAQAARSVEDEFLSDTVLRWTPDGWLPES